MADAEVGRIIGYLALDRSDWDAELAAAARKADELSRHDPNIRISTNAPSAIAQLAAVAAATKKLQDAQGAERIALSRLSALQASGKATEGQLAVAEERLAKARRSTAAATIGLAAAHDRNDQAMARAVSDTENLARSEDKASRSGSELVKALAAIAPAAVPIGAVATGALAALIPVTATVILGIKGITEEFKNGQLAGTQYGQDIASLQGEFGKLKSIAANGLLSGLDRAMQQSSPLFKTLNQDIGMMSHQLGGIVASAAPALLKILQALNPLFVTFGNLISAGAKDLEHWATNSDGVSRFVAYVQQELPTVLSLIEHLAVLFGHVVQAAAPIGDVILHVLNGIATALDAIPVGVLTQLGYGLVALYTVTKVAAGFKALKGAILGMNPAVAVITAVAVAGYAAGKAINNWIEGGRTTAAVAKQLAGATQEWTQALVDSNGALTENIRLQIGEALQQDGLAAKASKAGISLSQLINGVVTPGTGALYKLEAAWKAGGAPSSDTLFALQTLHLKYQGSIADAKALRIDQDSQSASAKILAGVNRGLASSLNGASTAAHGLSTALEALVQARLASAQTEDQFLEAVRGVTAALEKNDGSLSKHTAHGLANRDAFLNAASAALSFHDAQIKAGVSTDAANKKLTDNIKKLEDNAIAAGGDKGQVDNLLRSLGLLGVVNATPKITLHGAAAAQAASDAVLRGLNAINGRTFTARIQILEAIGAITSGVSKGLGHNAAGTMNWRGGLTYLAENGPELVELPRGSKVYPNNSPQTQAALHGGGDQRPVVVNVNAPQSLDPMATAYAVGRQTVAALGLAG